MSMIIGSLLAFFILLHLLEVAVNWRIDASQFDE